VRHLKPDRLRQFQPNLHPAEVSQSLSLSLCVERGSRHSKFTERSGWVDGFLFSLCHCSLHELRERCFKADSFPDGSTGPRVTRRRPQLTACFLH
jgi:hypothetical protein